MERTNGIAIGDVDGDADLDLLCANWNRPVSLCTNDGTGRFTLATASGLDRIALIAGYVLPLTIR